MKDLEKTIKVYLEERGWHILKPANLAKSISIEAAELLELFQWSNESVEEVKADKEKLEKIKNELADILTYCLDLSVILNFDTEKIIRNKLDQVKKKFPAHLMRKIQKKSEPGISKDYWKIKKNYRKKGL